MRENDMKNRVPFTQFVQSTPLFTLKQVRERYGKDKHNRSIVNMLYRLKKQGRVLQLTKGVYSGALAAVPLNRYSVPSALREDAVLALHSALEWHGVANQVFQTVYYFSAFPRRDIQVDDRTYHRVAPLRALHNERHKLFQVQLGPDQVLATSRERSFVDCLVFLDYSGGVEELDKCLAMFPSFSFAAALEYLKLLRKPWLYSRLGFLLDRHADKLFFRGDPRDQFLRRLPKGVAYLGSKHPGNRWVPTWRLMVPEALTSAEGRVQT
jgi:predicted transcriptional regulator of viral defense system